MYDNKIVDAGEDGNAKAYFSPMYINSAQEYFALPKVRYAKGKLYRKPGIAGAPQQAQTGTGGYFYTNMSFGISERSPVKDEAWSFMKFLLSEDMQGMPDSTRGFPLNRKVLDKQLQQLIGEGAVQVAYGPNKGKKVEVAEADAKQLEQLLSEAGRPLSNNDRVLKEMIEKESEAFFAGQKSAEDVAKLLQNRVTTYLNE
jgi:multiple sugar transport system substrate-binding protein